MPKILLVEDDPEIARNILDFLRTNHHYITDHVDNGHDALDSLSAYQYDILILDWNIPGVSGVQVLKEFRQRGGMTPALLLTANAGIKDKETGFDAGVDDYLTKPFLLKELGFRIEALLRRPRERIERTVTVGDITLSRDSFTVFRGQDEIHLAPKEFDLLEFFLRNPERVFTGEALLQRIWTSDPELTTETVAAAVKRLRKKLDKTGEESVIQTIFGVGYKLVAPTKKKFKETET